ncbi:MAG: arylsulfatase [Planctomycetaceae bacterium]
MAIILQALCLATLLLFPEPVCVASDRPNILLMMVDDLGFSDFGCYGSEIRTPNVDALAAGGIRMSQFYNTAKCHSSRICLLTGKYTFQAGNEAMDQALTAGEVMKANGYATSMTGKWHLRQQPTDRGFERYWGHLSGATNYFVGDNTFRLNGEPWSDFGKDFYTTDANVDYAIQFIDEAITEKKPFFHYIAFNAPHYPLQAKRQDIEKYRGVYSDGWDAVRHDRYEKQLKLGIINSRFKLSERPDYIPAWEELTADERRWEEDRMEVFAAMVDCVDQNIGRLVAHLKSRGVFDNTLILLVSDNGACPFERTRGREFQPWDHRSYWCYDVGWAHVGNTPFRWYKQNQHEGGVSSPLIAHWPDGLTAAKGSVSDQPGHLIDLLATCVDAADAEYPSEYGGIRTTPIQGKSLLPLLKGQQREPHEWLYFQFANNRALRRGDWKVVSAAGGRWELYNLAEDRTELNDRSTEMPWLTKELADLWFQVAEQTDGLPQNFRKPVGDSLMTFPASSMTARKAGPGKADVNSTPGRSTGKREGKKGKNKD